MHSRIFPAMQRGCHRPMDEDEMLGISGIGQSKLERDGDAFLEVITAYSR